MTNNILDRFTSVTGRYKPPRGGTDWVLTEPSKRLSDSTGRSDTSSPTISQQGNYLGFDVKDFIYQYSQFVVNNLGKITNFYTGVEKNPDIQSFKMLDHLLYLSDILNSAAILNESRFDNSEYWDVIEMLDDIRTSLQSAKNMAKWVRSTTADGDFNTNPEASVVLEQYNTLEMLASKAGYDDPQNSWERIAMRNDLDEDDYDLSGGNVLKINVLSGIPLVVDDVVDRCIGDNMKGKDILVNIEYKNDDLNTVEGDDCLFQCYNTLLKLKKGDIPEFPELGQGVIPGGNMALFSYPTVLRQLHKTFETDSSVKTIGIGGLKVDNDTISLDVLLESKFGDILKKGSVV